MNLIKKLRLYFAQWGLMARLTLFVSLFFVFVWIFVANHVWHKDSLQTQKFFDRQMVLLAKTIAEISNFETSEGNINFNKHQSNRNVKKQIRIEDETFSFAVFSRKGRHLLSGRRHGRHFSFASNQGFVDEIIDGESWRTFWYIDPHSSNVIAVGYKSEYRQGIVLEILFNHMTPWILFLIFFLIIFRFLLKHELKSLHYLRNKLLHRDPQDIEPIEIADVSAELRPLVQALNALFERTALLIERERAFVANAAHELRTPLSGLRLQVEVLDKCVDDSTARKNALSRILEASQRCTRLIDQLLMLSNIETKHCEYNKNHFNYKEIHWNSLLQYAEGDVFDAACAKNISLEFTCVDENVCSKGFPELWAIALRNLLDNAIRYTSTNGIVRVVLEKDGLRVENSAEHLPPNIINQLGQRFYRPAGQKEMGSGLGLAIIQHIIELHNASMIIENAEIYDKNNALITGICVRIKFN